MQRVFKYLLSFYFKILFSTYRLHLIDKSDEGENLPFNKRHGIFYIWHEHVLSGLYFLAKRKTQGHLITDNSSEGQLGRYIARKMGLRSISGDSKIAFKIGRAHV